MATKCQIIKYWQENMPEHLNDGQITKGQCFACGGFQQLERAHITPKLYGGTDTADNLHILCKPCHLASEDLLGKPYWDWYAYTFNNEFDFGLRQAIPKAHLIIQYAKQSGLYKDDPTPTELAAWMIGWKNSDPNTPNQMKNKDMNWLKEYANPTK